ncbi:hypothetical protein MGN70_000099 [Eutypa lata]|uniref:Putative ubiquitin supergroup protein n=1 Tax=Eutypa lata (strain UCR-EL1) TaxID=1287681 RepID=M7SC29_EUTLA|nr:putative ubiquitin supergroup protein [Eutypa lata UCREL1]KAI1257060.1 hypothetical protein MGN70_000099 [Eutypa lata]
MTEVNFARSFLSMLDSRPVKLSPEHVEDPKSYPARSAYTLPKAPRPLTKRRPARALPGQEPSVSVVVKSLRNPPLDVRLASQGTGTSCLDIKALVAAETGIAADKLKLLHRRKPVPDSKILKDLLGSEDETAVEFSVMVMGGAAAAGGAGTTATTTATAKDVAQGASGGEVLDTAEFWDDLRGFLLQRVRDEKLAGELSEAFQTAWKAKR